MRITENSETMITDFDPISSQPKLEQHADLSQIHMQLAVFNRSRLDPKLPSKNWKQEIGEEAFIRILENEMLHAELDEIQSRLVDMPLDPKKFMEWFEELRLTGPGQNDPLFDWLEESANHEEMTWFIRQEVAGEAGFEDLTALTQVKMPTRPKLELARNYWDEMGRGNEKGMHGPMLSNLAHELQIEPPSLQETMPEAAALGNIMMAMALNRRYAYHSAGALGVIELTAPGRALKVYHGLKRLGLSPEAQRYYLIHSSLDIKHSEAWNAEVLFPLVTENPALAKPIAEGALLRLNAGKRCFERYRKELWGSSH
ncbi:iron-containing redox enzyme family protein [Bdellovibrio sp. SKB1291214]|uniref:iron-containing redox enzyme family protein n=1 Tax=Bdellovibrio sp. SKB1291214 TaxID=1732569 RepID=UPI001C3DA035|nr:iron-containing redox enzyme family protein [Bdellovibrio sp. SKB1291214]UYL07878.1 iron-containing redox enzyme family protein [Bdellovibrio sp. SKB1291214]